MRGAVPGARSPHPLAATLPGMFAEDPFTQELCAGLDEVLAPVIATLDAMDALVDARLTPSDLLPWLATWTGTRLDVGLSPLDLRALLTGRPEAGLGTRAGIAFALKAQFDVPAEVTDNGGTSWSRSPEAGLPGDPGATVTVVVRVADDATVDERRLDDAVAAVKPCHVAHRVMVQRGR